MVAVRDYPAEQNEQSVIIRERGGNSVPDAFHSESQASAFIRVRIAKGTVLHPDEAGSWDNLHERFEVKRINHQEAYALDGTCTNWAEEYFSRLRRAEIGVHHHIAGAYLLRYAQESSWREDNRRVSNGDQVNRLAALSSAELLPSYIAPAEQRHHGHAVALVGCCLAPIIIVRMDSDVRARLLALLPA